MLLEALTWNPEVDHKKANAGNAIKVFMTNYTLRFGERNFLLMLIILFWVHAISLYYPL